MSELNADDLMARRAKRNEHTAPQPMHPPCREAQCHCYRLQEGWMDTVTQIKDELSAALTERDAAMSERFHRLREIAKDQQTTSAAADYWQGVEDVLSWIMGEGEGAPAIEVWFALLDAVSPFPVEEQR